MLQQVSLKIMMERGGMMVFNKLFGKFKKTEVEDEEEISPCGCPHRQPFFLVALLRADKPGEELRVMPVHSDVKRSREENEHADLPCLSGRTGQPQPRDDVWPVSGPLSHPGPVSCLRAGAGTASGLRRGGLFLQPLQHPGLQAHRSV